MKNQCTCNCFLILVCIFINTVMPLNVLNLTFSEYGRPNEGHEFYSVL